MPRDESGLERPFGAYNFSIRVDGIDAGHFTTCSGLEVRVTPIAYREAGAAQVVHHYAGPVHHGQVRFDYGVTDNAQLWEWFTEGLRGQTDFRNVTVSVLDVDGVTERVHWNLIKAWPSAWRGVLFDALGESMAIESLSLCYTTIERDPPGR